MHNRRVKGAKSPARAGVVAVALIIVLLAVSAKHLLQTPAESAAAPGAPPPALPADAPAAGQQGHFRVEVDWNTALSGDPFTSRLVFPPKAPAAPVPPPPPGEKAEELAQVVRRSIKLNGTFLGSHPVAIMNGKMFRTGDQVEGFVLLQIGSREVILEKDGVQVTLAEREAGK